MIEQWTYCLGQQDFHRLWQEGSVRSDMCVCALCVCVCVCVYVCVCVREGLGV